MAAEHLLFGAALEELSEPEFRPGNLATKFLQPPFTVLDTRKGDWQERRRSWLSLGIQSELGRDGQLISKATEREGYGADYDTSKGENAWGGKGTSIFDPVLCELAYRWWAPPEGRILDPFAGGSVRGIVAAKLGHPYHGIDLAGAQVAANREQADRILLAGEPVPKWHHADSREALAEWALEMPEGGPQFDMVFSCPPYYDLEVYSDDPADLSAMSWHDFLAGYEAIIELAAQHLRPERFAVFVVSEIRDPEGYCRGLVPRTIGAFERVGLRLYNEAVLVNSAGSLPLRVTKYMEASRKLGRAHQNVLCFVKGKPPRGWSYDRAAPPSPQLALELEPEPPHLLPAVRGCEVPGCAFVAEEGGTLCEPHRIDDEAGMGELSEALSLTPVEARELSTGGRVWLKRDDLFEVAGVRGGKARSCWALAQGAAGGLVTAGSRSSPQANIVAQVGRELGLPVRLHMPAGSPTEEQALAREAGAEIVEHRPGHNSVIVARARADAAERGWREIPFGMECEEAVEATAAQVANLPAEAQRLVVAVGSGMSLAGILHGLARAGRELPVVGMVVGADPSKRLDKWAPADWRERVELRQHPTDYHHPERIHPVLGVELDAHYEAKAAAVLQPGDVLWCVGLRSTQAQAEPRQPPLAPAAEPEPEPAPVGPDSDDGRQGPFLEPEPPGEGPLPSPLREEEPWEPAVELLPPPVPEGLVPTDDGRWADQTTGEVYERVPAPERAEWERIRERAWSLADRDRRCWTCGAPPTGRAHDGGPAYDHSHNPEVLAMFPEEGTP